ncbi:hypothetical protein LINGRAHAP2_LOCUS28702 [Linum grandiflorum]
MEACLNALTLSEAEAQVEEIEGFLTDRVFNFEIGQNWRRSRWMVGLISPTSSGTLPVTMLCWQLKEIRNAAYGSLIAG